MPRNATITAADLTDAINDLTPGFRVYFAPGPGTLAQRARVLIEAWEIADDGSEPRLVAREYTFADFTTFEPGDAATQRALLRKMLNQWRADGGVAD